MIYALWTWAGEYTALSQLCDNGSDTSGWARCFFWAGFSGCSASIENTRNQDKPRYMNACTVCIHLPRFNPSAPEFNPSMQQFGRHVWISMVRYVFKKKVDRIASVWIFCPSPPYCFRIPQFSLYIIIIMYLYSTLAAPYLQAPDRCELFVFLLKAWGSEDTVQRTGTTYQIL